MLPLQSLLVANRHFDVFSVVHPGLHVPGLPVVIKGLADDPERYLERNAKISGAMGCSGCRMRATLLLLEFPAGPWRRFCCSSWWMVVLRRSLQEAASRNPRRRPVARHIDRSFSYRAFGLGVASAEFMEALALCRITLFKAPQVSLRP